MSDHNSLHLKIQSGEQKRNTLWRLNTGFLNNEETIDWIKSEIQKYTEENDNGEVNPANPMASYENRVEG